MGKHKYVVQRGGKRFGPFSSRQLRELARQAKLKPDDIVSYEGASEGVPARAVRGLFEGAANPNKVQSEPPSVVPSGALTSLSPTERTPIAPLTTVTPSTSTRRTGGLVAAAIGIAIVLGIALGGYVAILAIRGRDGTASVAATGRADAGFDKAEKAKASTVANRPQEPSVDEPGSSEPADATDAGAATPRRPDHAPVQGDVPIAPTDRSDPSGPSQVAAGPTAPSGPGDSSTTPETPKAAEQKSVTADSIEQHLKAMGFDVPAGGSVFSFTVSSGVMDGIVSGARTLPRPFGLPQKATGNSFVQYSYDIENKNIGVKIAARIESGRFFFFVPQSDTGKSAIQDLLKRLDAQLPEKFVQLDKRFESAKTDAERKGCREKLESIHLVVTSEGTIITSPDWPTMASSEDIIYGLSDDGRTSLMIAAGRFQVDRVLALLQKGADPKAKTKDGNTALHFLCEESHGYMSEEFGKIAAALIEKGADPNAKNGAGRGPLDLAHTTTNGEMATFMRKHGAKWVQSLP